MVFCAGCLVSLAVSTSALLIGVARAEAHGGWGGGREGGGGVEGGPIPLKEILVFHETLIHTYPLIHSAKRRPTAIPFN